MKVETEIEKLKNLDSYSFLGSALALSCYFLVVRENEEMAEDFLRLSLSDALLYQNQVEGGLLRKEKVEACLDDYRIAIHDLEELQARRTPTGFHQIVSANARMAKSLYVLSSGESGKSVKDGEVIMLNKRRYLFEFDEEVRKECSYPLLLVFLKLMERKNRGKKPFLFDEEGKNTVVLLKKAAMENDFGYSLMRKAEELARLCVPQIKMESLRDDFRYLSEMFHILGSEK